MKKRIDIVRLGELEGYMQNDFWKTSDVIPITSLRMSSFLNNPKANEEDVVMICAFDDELLSAFRLLIPDYFYTEPKYKFAWKSGIWVRKEYRGEGLAKKLSLLALDRWNDRMIGIDYAPESKLMYLSTGKYVEFQQLVGMRFYKKWIFGELLKNRIPNLLLIPVRVLDALGNGFQKIINNKTNLNDHEYIFKELNDLNVLLDFDINADNFRRLEDYEWIRKYPWVSKDKNNIEEDSRFPFSLYASDYMNTWITYEEGKSRAVLQVIIKNGHLEVPHYFSRNISQNQLEGCLKSLMDYYAIDYISTFNSDIIKVLKNKSWVFKKKLVRDVMGTKTLEEKMDELNLEFDEGAGDVPFT